MGKLRFLWIVGGWCLVVGVGAVAAAALPTPRLLAQRHHRQGDLLSGRGRYVAAVNEYQQAAALDPRDARTENDWGYSLFCLGQVGASVAHYRRALRLRPGYAGAHNNLGAAYYRQQRYAEAQREFEEALRLRPGDVKARMNLASCLYRQGSYLQAVRELLRARTADRSYLERRLDSERVRSQIRHDLHAHPHDPWLRRAMTYLDRHPKRAATPKRRPVA